MLAEEQLDLAVEGDNLGPGERVLVLTKSGTEVARGVVRDVYPDGAVWVVADQHESKIDQQQVYDPSLYSFVPMDDPTEDDDDSGDSPDAERGRDGGPALSELDADERVLRKMESLGINLEADDEDEPEAKDKKLPGTKGDKSGDDDDDGRAKDKDKLPSKVNLDDLPDDLRQKVVGLNQLDDSSRDRVLSAVSNSSLRALKDVGVNDSESYRVVVKIQDAVIKVLGGDQK